MSDRASDDDAAALSDSNHDDSDHDLAHDRGIQNVQTAVAKIEQSLSSASADPILPTALTTPPRANNFKLSDSFLDRVKRLERTLSASQSSDSSTFNRPTRTPRSSNANIVPPADQDEFVPADVAVTQVADEVSVDDETASRGPTRSNSQSSLRVEAALTPPLVSNTIAPIVQHFEKIQSRGPSPPHFNPARSASAITPSTSSLHDRSRSFDSKAYSLVAARRRTFHSRTSSPPIDFAASATLPPYRSPASPPPPASRDHVPVNASGPPVASTRQRFESPPPPTTMDKESAREIVSGNLVTPIVERLEAAQTAVPLYIPVSSMSEPTVAVDAEHNEQLAPRDDTDAATIETAATFGSDKDVAEIIYFPEPMPSSDPTPETAANPLDMDDDENASRTADQEIVNDTVAQDNDTSNIGAQDMAESAGPDTLQTSPTSLSTLLPAIDDASSLDADAGQADVAPSAADHGSDSDKADGQDQDVHSSDVPMAPQTTEMSAFTDEAHACEGDKHDVDVDVDSRLDRDRDQSVQLPRALAPLRNNGSPIIRAGSGDKEGALVFVAAAAAENQPVLTTDIVRDAEQGLAQLELGKGAVDEKPVLDQPDMFVETTMSAEEADAPGQEEAASPPQEGVQDEEEHETNLFPSQSTVRAGAEGNEDVLPGPVANEIIGAQEEDDLRDLDVSGLEVVTPKVSGEIGAAPTVETVASSSESTTVVEENTTVTQDEEAAAASEKIVEDSSAYVPVVTSFPLHESGPRKLSFEEADVASTPSPVNTFDITATITKHVVDESPNKTTVSSLAMERAAPIVDTVIITNGATQTCPIPIVTIPDTPTDDSNAGDADGEVKTIPLQNIISSSKTEDKVTQTPASTDSLNLSPEPATADAPVMHLHPLEAEIKAETPEQVALTLEQETRQELPAVETVEAGIAVEQDVEQRPAETETNLADLTVKEGGEEVDEARELAGNQATEASVEQTDPIVEQGGEQDVGVDSSEVPSEPKGQQEAQDINIQAENKQSDGPVENEVSPSPAIIEMDNSDVPVEETSNHETTGDEKAPEPTSIEKVGEPMADVAIEDQRASDEPVDGVETNITQNTAHPYNRGEGQITNNAAVDNSNNLPSATSQAMAQQEIVEESSATVQQAQEQDETSEEDDGTTIDQASDCAPKDDEKMGAVVCIPSSAREVPDRESRPILPDHPAIAKAEKSVEAAEDVDTETTEDEGATSTMDEAPVEEPQISELQQVKQDELKAVDAKMRSVESPTSTAEQSGSLTTISSSTVSDPKVDEACETPPIAALREAAQPSIIHTEVPKSPVQLIQQQLAADKVAGGVLSFEDMSLEGDDDFTNVVTDVEVAQRRAEHAASASQGSTPVPASNEAPPAVPSARTCTAVADIFAKDEPHSMPSFRSSLGIGRHSSAGGRGGSPVTPLRLQGSKLRQPSERSPSRSPIVTPSRSPVGTPSRTASGSPRTPKLDRMLPAPGARSSDRVTRAIAPIRAITSEFRGRTSAGSRNSSPGNTGPGMGRRGSLPASVERPPRVPRVAKLGMGGRFSGGTNARDDAAVGGGTGSPSGAATARFSTPEPATPPQRRSTLTPSSRLPRVAGLNGRLGPRTRTQTQISMSPPAQMPSTRIGMSGGRASGDRRSSMLPSAGQREASLRRTVSLTHDRVLQANGRGRMSVGPADLRGGAAGRSAAERRASLMAAGEIQHHGLGRPRVTVPKPFHLTGGSLQEKSMAAIEEARRKTEELENRRRVFVARPMPDFSRPSPPPKLK